MPVSAAIRRLGSRWEIVQQRAEAFRRTLPCGGVARSAYANAVLHDVDPGAVDEVLILLHRRGIAWVRRSRGNVRVFPQRPASISMPRTVADEPVAELCARIAGHMLALGRAEEARRTAQTDGLQGVAIERGEAASRHADRALAIVRQHTARGLCLSAVRAALPLAFSEPALSALVRWEPRLHKRSEADDLTNPERVARPRRIPPGLSPERKALALIAKRGLGGATRSDLMNAIRPKPKAAEIDAILCLLENQGAIVAGTKRLHAGGRPGTRYFAAEVGLPIVEADGTAIVRSI